MYFVISCHWNMIRVVVSVVNSLQMEWRVTDINHEMEVMKANKITEQKTTTISRL